MRTTARQTRENRTVTVDFQNEATYFQLLGDGKAFVECVLAFLLALGLQLKHKATCDGGGCLTRHSHYARVRLGGGTLWRIQCTTCRAVFTVLPHFVLRYRQMRPAVARDALLATHGGLSLELCAVLYHLSPTALYRLICAFGHQSLVTVLTRCGLPLPVYFLADEKHSRCLTDKIYLPTIVCGRVLWHLGYTEAASTAAFTQSYRAFQQAALQRKGLRVFALGQRLRHVADHVTQTAGTANGERVRRWFQEKKAGWYAVLADPHMPATSTLLDQAHNAIERKLFAMKGFHHPNGSHQAFLRGLAHLYNLIPYQRRAQHAGQCGVEVEGGRVPPADWFLNVQTLTSGGFR